MKNRTYLTIVRSGILLCFFITISTICYSQSCHGSESTSGIQKHSQNKAEQNSNNYKKSTKNKNYVCKNHHHIKSSSKDLCNICNTKLKKKKEYIFE